MDKEIQYNGNRLRYRVSGNGSPLILMHGWGCHRDTVASIERVAAETHTVYNVDFPGFGQSPEPDSVWGVEEYTRLIEELARVEGMEKPVLVGHSFGGRVGVLMASRNPVGKLILVDAAGVKPRRSLKYYLKVYSYKASRRVLTTLFGRERGMKMVDKLRGKSGSADYNSASPQMRRILSKVVNEDLKHVMPSITAPTLLIWGENDTATPLSDAKTMERLIPDAGLVSFPGCGHYSFLDNPAQFAAVLRSFLKA
ncbi:MAG: alpha/beta hydrolase [Muribaculaceae bacterium]|nr:alpha/beta hydrolase [Muribaculaceae bacterium]